MVAEGFIASFSFVLFVGFVVKITLGRLLEYIGQKQHRQCRKTA
jgi:hypothetical protein